MTGLPASAATAPAAAATTPSSGAARTARDFEAVFAAQLAQLLLEQVEVSGDFGGGHGEAMFRGVLAEELGKAIAETGTLGIAPAVRHQIHLLEDKTP